MPQNVTLEMVYQRLAKVDNRLKAVEHALLPEVRLSAKERAALEAARKSIRAGHGISLKEYLAARK